MLMEYLLRLLAANWQTVSAVVVTAVAVVLSALILQRRRKNAAPPVTLQGDRWIKLRLIQRLQVSHNVVKFRFSLPSSNAVLGLPIGQHVSIQGIDSEGKEFSRPYTPTTLDSDRGVVDLVIKIYPDGAMSQFLSTLKVGQSLPFKGPRGRFTYEVGSVKAFGMIAGGTGVTPMFQVARAVLENPNDPTPVNLIFANVNEDDILLKDELLDLEKKYGDQFGVHFVLNNPPAGWKGGVGFVSADMIRNYLPPPERDVKILRCGPPAMNKAMAEHLDKLGYPPAMLFQF